MHPGMESKFGIQIWNRLLSCNTTNRPMETGVLRGNALREKIQQVAALAAAGRPAKPLDLTATAARESLSEVKAVKAPYTAMGAIRPRGKIEPPPVHLWSAVARQAAHKDDVDRPVSGLLRKPTAPVQLVQPAYMAPEMGGGGQRPEKHQQKPWGSVLLLSALCATGVTVLFSHS